MGSIPVRVTNKNTTSQDVVFFVGDPSRKRRGNSDLSLLRSSHFASKADLSPLAVATSKNIRRRRNSRTHHRVCIFLSKSQTWHIIAAGVYHHRRCIPLRLDDIQCLRIDDMPQRVADDIHAFGVIGIREYENLLNYLPKYDIIQKR